MSAPRFYRTPAGKIMGPWGPLSLNGGWWWADVGAPIMPEEAASGLPIYDDSPKGHMSWDSVRPGDQFLIRRLFPHLTDANVRDHLYGYPEIDGKRQWIATPIS